MLSQAGLEPFRMTILIFFFLKQGLWEAAKKLFLFSLKCIYLLGGVFLIGSV